MEKVNQFKVGLSALVAILTALWGWFGWLIVLWVALMAADYVSGSFSAMRHGAWTSREARDGIWRKCGSIIIVLVAGAADLLIGYMLGHLPGIALPFAYSVLICPVVVVWYSLTEMGSIVENAVALGAPCPAWLSSAIDKLQDAVDGAMEETHDD